MLRHLKMLESRLYTQTDHVENLCQNLDNSDNFHAQYYHNNDYAE